MGEWIKKMWSIHTMEYYSDTKKVGNQTTWMGLEGIMLSEINQTDTI